MTSAAANQRDSNILDDDDADAPSHSSVAIQLDKNGKSTHSLKKVSNKLLQNQSDGNPPQADQQLTLDQAAPNMDQGSDSRIRLNSKGDPPSFADDALNTRHNQSRSGTALNRDASPSISDKLEFIRKIFKQDEHNIIKEELARLMSQGESDSGNMLNEFYRFCKTRLQQDQKYKDNILSISLFYYFLEKKKKKQL